MLKKLRCRGSGVFVLWWKEPAPDDRSNLHTGKLMIRISTYAALLVVAGAVTACSGDEGGWTLGSSPVGWFDSRTIPTQGQSMSGGAMDTSGTAPAESGMSTEPEGGAPAGQTMSGTGEPAATQ
jgi:hypothetical protein